MVMFWCDKCLVIVMLKKYNIIIKLGHYKGLEVKDINLFIIPIACVRLVEAL